MNWCLSVRLGNTNPNHFIMNCLFCLFWPFFIFLTLVFHFLMFSMKISVKCRCSLLIHAFSFFVQVKQWSHRCQLVWYVNVVMYTFNIFILRPQTRRNNKEKDPLQECNYYCSSHKDSDFLEKVFIHDKIGK